MKLASECMSCLIKQVERAIRLLKPEFPNGKIVEVQQKLMKYIVDQEPSSLCSEVMGKITYQIIAEALDREDPYNFQKEKYNNLAMKLYPDLKELVKKSPNPLKQAFIISIIGNAIDFGAPIEINFQELTDFTKHSLDENIDYGSLSHEIENANNILILGDNAGEIVFDKILIEVLTELFPKKHIFYGVRGGPIINDATIEDAMKIGLTNICQVVETSQSPGVILNQSPRKFQELFNSTDIIISKGQGNFESIITTPTPTQSVFFLLKAKCALISRIFQVPQGTLVLRQKTVELIEKSE